MLQYPSCRENPLIPAASYQQVSLPSDDVSVLIEDASVPPSDMLARGALLLSL